MEGTQRGSAVTSATAVRARLVTIVLAAVIVALLAFIVLSFHSTVAVAASTLAAAALFTPLRRIDLTGVHRALEPAHVSVWLSPRD